MILSRTVKFIENKFSNTTDEEHWDSNETEQLQINGTRKIEIDLTPTPNDPTTSRHLNLADHRGYM